MDKILEHYETMQFHGNLRTYLPCKHFIVYQMLANNKNIDIIFFAQT